MPAPDRKTSDRSRPRGLLVPSVQRTQVARYAIRAIRIGRATLRRALGVLLAVVIVFEEWGWRPLAALLGLLAQLRPIAWLEGQIGALPPWGSVCVFALPTLLFLPLKFAALWLIAGGHLVSAALLFAFAKVAGTAIFARIFQLTQPRLMELEWFARLYNWFLPWKEHLVEQARATEIWQATVRFKHAVKVAANDAWVQMRPMVLALVARIRASVGR